MDTLQELQGLENLKEENVEKPLQKIKIKKGENPVTEDAVIVKQKKPRSEKQIEAFNKARGKMVTNLNARKEKQEQDAIQKQKEIEEKIVKKAIAIKKREIKSKAILDSIPDDDTPIEEIKKIATKVPVKVAEKEPEKPKTFFEKYRFI